MQTSSTGYDIAVIGLACRFPGARTPSQFWNNLVNGVESVKFFSDEELLAGGESPEKIKDPAYVKAQPALDEFDCFDAGFFGFSPQDAAIMDPQHRLFLEVGWEALEDAAHKPSFPGNVGVFATCGMNSYMMYHLIANRRIMENVGEWLVRHTGNDMNFLATRLSYELGLKGPSMNVQTACSSGLVAIHLASQSLLTGESDIALAGGSTIALPHNRGYLYQQNEILSPDGHCRSFDANARGTIFGSGVGVVVLRRLQDALDAGDRILAVIKGSAINNDGSAKVGYLAPSVEGQARAITEALSIAGIEPETISYMEAHGTGTIVGDPIEVSALTRAYRQFTQKKGFCALGSVKSNIGHLGEAAGVAAFIKAVLMLQHRQIPPSLHYESSNPQIDFPTSPFFVNAKLTPWPASAEPRRAGITALGAGGTNCHVILEEPPAAQQPASGPARACQLLLWSAKSETALDSMTRNLTVHLKENLDLDLADVAYTLALGRSSLPYRRALVCRTRTEAITAGESGQGLLTSSGKAQERPVAFLFPGQGAQYPNMGRGLYESEAPFRAAFDEGAELLNRDRGIDLRSVIFTSTPDDQARQQLSQTAMSQPALFLIEYSLAKLWMSWGVQPAAMLGHSIGEYVAACLAGVFSLADGVALVADRGRLMQQAQPGLMLAVSLPGPEVQKVLASVSKSLDLSLSVENGPNQSVVGGPEESITALEAELTARGVQHQRLQTSHAFHSAMMDPILASFGERVRRVALRPPTIRYLSNLTGTWIRPEEATNPDYWVQHLRNTVRFSECMSVLIGSTDQVLLEVGPGRTLIGLARQQPVQPAGSTHSLGRPGEETTDQENLLRACGYLWVHGCKLDSARLYDGQRRNRVSLPTYPFEHRRYWIEADPVVASAPTGAASANTGRLVKRPDIADWFLLPTWQRSAPPVKVPPQIGAPPGWLIFMDECGLGSDLIKAWPKPLEGAAAEVYRVRAGKAFRRLNQFEFIVNPGHAPDYIALLAALEGEPEAIGRITHLWNVTSEKKGKESLLDSLNHGFFSLTWLTQALGRRGWSQEIDLAVISTGMQQVAGETPLQPVKSTLLGPCRVTPREHPNISTRSIDVSFTKSWQRQRVVEQLLVELGSVGKERIVAYRNADRWVQRFQPAPLPSAKPGVTLRRGGVYLITGGLGGLGFELAEHLCREANAKVVLVGRSPMPLKGEWEQWLSSHDEYDSTSEKIRRIRRCESAGGNVLALSADVTNAAQIRAVVSETRKQFGEINGVIHAAGTFVPGLIQQKTREAAWEVLAPKVQGTLILEEAVRGERLDFFVLFSSVSSALGSFGHVDYTAANAFLDAFAASRAAEGAGRTIAINWSIWQEVGMATKDIQGKRGTQNNPHRSDSIGLSQKGRSGDESHVSGIHMEALRQGMTTRQGIEAFERVLASGVAPQVVVSTVEFDLWMKHSDTSAKPTPPSAAREATAVSAGDAAKGDRTERWLAEVYGQLLGVDEVSLQDDFFDLGGHSLLAVRLLTRIEKQFNKVVPLPVLFQASSVERLAKFLRGEDKESSKKPSVIVPLNEGGEGPAFFCVHSVGGEVMSFRHLARLLGPDQRFYGIAPPPELRTAEFGSSIQAMARCYADALVEFQPNGPYILGGWSAGSMIALEMAQLLKASGREVELLVALDGSPGNTGIEASLWNPLNYWKLLCNFPYWVIDDLMVDFQLSAFSRRVWSKIVSISRKTTAFLGGKAHWRRHEIDGFLDTSAFSDSQAGFMRALYGSLHTYFPKPYSGRVLLYRATTQPLYHLLEVERPWRSIASDVEMVPVRGTHISIMVEPHVRAIANDLRERLSRLHPGVVQPSASLPKWIATPPAMAVRT